MIKEEMSLESVVRDMHGMDATDIHIKSDGRVYYRKQKQIRLYEDRLSYDEIEKFIKNRAERIELDDLEKKGSADIGHTFSGIRVRMNIYRVSGRFNLALRILNDRSIRLESLRLPKEAERLIYEKQGLILITGATGSGKSTTLSAVISEINRKRSCHVVMIEDPVEYRYENDNSLITQIEIGRDSKSFAEALRASLRQDPDIIAVGEIRDAESLEIALRAAETGHLVISTLHTNSAAETVERISEMSRTEDQSQIRYKLSRTLKLILSQELRVKGNSIYPVFEILVPNNAVRNMIRKNRILQIQDCISVSRELGMMTKERYAEYISEEKAFL